MGIGIMIQIPFPFSDSTLRMSIIVFLLLSLCFIPAIPSDDEEDPCIPASCPVKCFRTDPVCGVDGVTYWCGRGDARCSGTKVAKKGFCEVRNNNGAAAQALLLLHIVWLIFLGFSLLFGLF